MIRLALAVLALAVLGAACEDRPRSAPLTFERMRDQPRYDAYGRSLHFDDGMAMRPLPPGTVARDAGAEVAVADHQPGASPAAMPERIDRALVERGRQSYDDFCRPCHGVDGAADTPVAHSMRLRPPPSLLDPRIRALDAGRLFAVVTQGYGFMPSYARQLPVRERWGVVAYVRALQLRADVALADLPPAVRAEASRSLEGQAGRE